MTIDDTTYKALAPLVQRAAFTVAGKWPEIIRDHRDLQNDIWVRLLEAGQHTIDVLMSMDRDNRLVTLREIGHQIASGHRDDYDMFFGNWNYGTKEVRELLEKDGLFATVEVPGDLLHSEVVDLQEGYKRLVKKNAVYANLIADVYARGTELPDGSDRMRLTRAVDALTREMNRYRKAREDAYDDGPGTKPVMSNYDWQKITGDDFEGVLG